MVQEATAEPWGVRLPDSRWMGYAAMARAREPNVVDERERYRVPRLAANGTTG